MPDTFKVELDPPAIRLEGTPVEALVGIQNLSNVVEEYTIRVEGLDPEWYDAPAAALALFPQDRERARLVLHAPKHSALREGLYPFQVVVRARSTGHEQAAGGTLHVTGQVRYTLDMAPRRQVTQRHGTFRVLLDNTGTADLRVALEASDPEEACRFRFAQDPTPVVPAGSKLEVPLVVEPAEVPPAGQERTYDFSVVARPADERATPQTVTGLLRLTTPAAPVAPSRRLPPAALAGAALIGAGLLGGAFFLLRPRDDPAGGGQAVQQTAVAAALQQTVVAGALATAVAQQTAAAGALATAAAQQTAAAQALGVPAATATAQQAAAAQAAATAAAQQTAAAQVAVRPVDPEVWVRTYYEAINQRRFSEAYSIFSRDAQRGQPLAQFQAQFADLINITVRYVDNIAFQPDGRMASLVAHTTTVYRSASGPVTNCWSVQWRLVLEDGVWKRSDLSQQPDPSCAPGP